MIVSHSECETYLLCTRRHYYAFGERIQKRTLSDSLQRGIQGHTFMEVFFNEYRVSRSWDRALGALANAYETVIFNVGITAEEMKRAAELQRRIVEFLEYFKSTIEQWDILAVEREFRVPIAHPEIDDLIYAFTPDLVVRHNGAVRVIDWKFIYNFYNTTALSLLPQIPKYIGALRELDWANVRDGLYGFIRYRSLKEPSKSQLYRLQPVTPNRVNIQQTWAEYRAVAKEIADLKMAGGLQGWLAQVKRVSNNLVCNSCAFKELCGAEKDGSTGVRIRQELYVPSTYGYVEVDE